MSQVFPCDLQSSPFADVRSVLDNLLWSSHNCRSVVNNQAIVTSFEGHHPSSSSRDSAVIQDARCRAACNMRLHHARRNLATADAGFRTSAAASVGSFVPFPRLLRARLLILLLNRTFLAAGSYMCYALGLHNDISRRPKFGSRTTHAAGMLILFLPSSASSSHACQWCHGGAWHGMLLTAVQILRPCINLSVKFEHFQQTSRIPRPPTTMEEPHRLPLRWLVSASKKAIFQLIISR